MREFGVEGMNRGGVLVAVVLVSVMVSSVGSMSMAMSQTGVQVPAEYAQLYSTLQAALDNYSSYLSTVQSSTTYHVTFGGELLPANANRGTALLAQGTMQGVILYLDRLRELGVGGVTVAIGYPLYTPSFPRYEEYVAFYKQVAQEVRSRGMKLDVESSLVFANSPFSTITFSYAGLTWTQFEAERKQMIQAIIHDLQPDYLNMGAEPDTEYKLSGFTEFNSPAEYVAYLNYILAGLDRGNTLLGAGVGTWGNMQYVPEYATATSLDFIDIHVYPIVGQASLQRVFIIAETAKQHGKKVLLDEAWLYKVGTLQSTSIAGNTDIFRLDAFSFFAPLDQRFLGIMVKAAQLADIEYVSPFWTTLFFSYADYTSATAGLPYKDLASMLNEAATQNMLNDQFSSTGEFYGQLARPKPSATSTGSSPSQLTVNMNTISTGGSGGGPSGLGLLIAAGLVVAIGVAVAVIVRKRLR